jgi:hypothetical protein
VSRRELMAIERSEAREQITATMEAKQTIEEHATSDDVFTVACYSADGELIWREQTTRVVHERRDEDTSRR